MAELDLLRSFLAVYRAGTVTGAARTLHLTQPAVSLQVKALESRMGRPLFRRGARGVTPTPAGHELAQSVAHHMDALEGAVGGRAGSAGSVTHSVHVGGPEEFLSIRVLPELLPLAISGMRLRLRFDVDPPLIAALLDGELDIAIVTSAAQERALVSQPLCFEYLHLVAAPAWQQRFRGLSPGPEGARMLAEAPVISYAEDLPLATAWWLEVFRSPPALSPAVVVNSLRAGLQLAIGGAGIAVLPSHVCDEAVVSGQLVRLLAPIEPPRNQLHLVWRAGTAARPGPREAHARIEAAARQW